MQLISYSSPTSCWGPLDGTGRSRRSACKSRSLKDRPITAPTCGRPQRREPGFTRVARSAMGGDRALNECLVRTTFPRVKFVGLRPLIRGACCNPLLLCRIAGCPRSRGSPLQGQGRHPLGNFSVGSFGSFVPVCGPAISSRFSSLVLLVQRAAVIGPIVRNPVGARLFVRPASSPHRDFQPHLGIEAFPARATAPRVYVRTSGGVCAI